MTTETRPGLSTAQLCRVAGITERQADYWWRKGWLIPSVHVSSGSGRAHRWSETDAVVGAVIDQVPPEMVQWVPKVVEVVRAGTCWSVCIGEGEKGCLVWAGEPSWATGRGGYRRILAINVGRVREGVRPRLSEERTR